ncbi:hypothetical protein ACWFRK_01305 [Streptomyces sp. NPDC055157]
MTQSRTTGESPAVCSARTAVSPFMSVLASVDGFGAPVTRTDATAVSGRKRPTAATAGGEEHGAAARPDEGRSPVARRRTKARRRAQGLGERARGN